MGNDTVADIEAHYLAIWEDFEIIGVLDLNAAERAWVYNSYCKEIRAVPDNTWCHRCIVDMFKELINQYKYERNNNPSNSINRA